MGRTALHYASANGCGDLIIALITAGADLNSVTIGGETPLMKAVFFTKVDCVQTLLQNGANPFLAENTGKTALEISTMVGSQEIYNLIQSSSR